MLSTEHCHQECRDLWNVPIKQHLLASLDQSLFSRGSLTMCILLLSIDYTNQALRIGALINFKKFIKFNLKNKQIRCYMKFSVKLCFIGLQKFARAQSSIIKSKMSRFLDVQMSFIKLILPRYRYSNVRIINNIYRHPKMYHLTFY